MSKVNRFEDLIAWQKSRELSRGVYAMTREDGFARDHGLSDQIRRASVSIMSNLAEGYERGSRADFARFVTIAKASCAEVRSQLYVALDASYVSQDQFDHAMSLANELSRILGGLRKSLVKEG